MGGVESLRCSGSTGKGGTGTEEMDSLVWVRLRGAAGTHRGPGGLARKILHPPLVSIQILYGL